MEVISMFERAHHQRIAKVLAGVRAEVFRENFGYFGGGTALALQLNEYRESVDIDFLCGRPEHYGRFRSGIFNQAQNYLFKDGVILSRELMVNREAIRCAIDLQDGQRPIKFEIILEGYLGKLREPIAEICGLPCLHPQDSLATKMMANADRGLDRAFHFRDLIDFLLAARFFGPVEAGTMVQVRVGYQDAAEQGLLKTVALLNQHPEFLAQAFAALDVTREAQEYVSQAIHSFDLAHCIST